MGDERQETDVHVETEREGAGEERPLGEDVRIDPTGAEVEQREGGEGAETRVTVEHEAPVREAK